MIINRHHPQCLRKCSEFLKLLHSHEKLRVCKSQSLIDSKTTFVYFTRNAIYTFLFFFFCSAVRCKNWLHYCIRNFQDGDKNTNTALSCSFVYNTLKVFSHKLTNNCTALTLHQNKSECSASKQIHVLHTSYIDLHSSNVGSII